MEATSAPVAVFPAEACTDLRCCVFEKMYLKKVVNVLVLKKNLHVPLQECRVCRCTMYASFTGGGEVKVSSRHHRVFSSALGLVRCVELRFSEEALLRIEFALGTSAYCM